MTNAIPYETLITVFGSLLTIIGGLLLFIFGQLNKKVESIEASLNELSERSTEEHAQVQACLGRLEENLRAYGRDIDRHERRLDDLEGRED